MRILLDHCVPHPVRALLGAHEVFTTRYLGWEELENGQLLLAAAAAGIDVFLTVDKRMQYEQNLSGLPLAVVIMGCRSNQLRDIAPLIPEVEAALPALAPKTIVVVGRRGS